MTPRLAAALIAAFVAAGCAGGPADPPPAPADPVPVHLEPMHRPVLETPALRVLDVRIPAGEASQPHVHAHDILYAVLDGSRVWSEAGDGERREADWGAGRVSTNTTQTARPVTHRVGNSGARDFRLIAVENLRPPAGPDAAGGAAAHAPLPAGLPAAEVAVDDARFRAARVRLPPGRATGAVAFDVPAVWILAGDGRAELHAAGGAPPPAALFERGAARAVPAGTAHRLVNPGGEPADLLVVEVRGARESPGPGS